MENMGRTWGNPLQNHKHRSKTRKGLYKIQNWSLLDWALTGLEPVFWIAWHSLATTKFQTTGRRLAPTSTCYQKQPLQNGKHGQKENEHLYKILNWGFFEGCGLHRSVAHVCDFVEGPPQGSTHVFHFVVAAPQGSTHVFHFVEGQGKQIEKNMKKHEKT